MDLTWWTTAPDSTLDYRCDLCGAPAESFHWPNYAAMYSQWVDIGGVIPCVFACKDHDPGGYWAYIKDWFDREEHWPSHLLGKQWGQAALNGLYLRIDPLRVVGRTHA